MYTVENPKSQAYVRLVIKSANTMLAMCQRKSPNTHIAIKAKAFIKKMDEVNVFIGLPYEVSLLCEEARRHIDLMTTLRTGVRRKEITTDLLYVRNKMIECIVLQDKDGDHVF